MVKSPRGRRRSPSKSPSRSPSRRSTGVSTAAPPDLGAGQSPKPEAESSWRSPVPTLYVTEADTRTPARLGGARPQPKWVEVEETVEVRVKKAGSASGLLLVLPGENPEGDLNANNSNNTLLAQQPQSQGDPGILHVNSRPEGSFKLPPFQMAEEKMDPLVELHEEPQEGDGLQGPGPKILTHQGRVLTLADLDDYVPQAGETFGCNRFVPSPSDEPPCEVSVLQREIGEPTVGQPVVLNVGRPTSPRSFFSYVGRPQEASPWEPQVLGPVSTSLYTQEAQAGAPSPWKSSFCTRVQRSADSGQSSFKTEVSTQTRSFGTVGETVTLHIRPSGKGAAGPPQD